MIRRLLVSLLLLLALPAAVTAQVCNPTDTLRFVRTGGALWTLVVGGDTVSQHTSGEIAAARGAVLSVLTGKEYELLPPIFRGRYDGCVPLLRDTVWVVLLDTVRVMDTVFLPPPPQQGDSLAPPPASDSLPPEVPEQPPQDTVAPVPGTPSARGAITCQPEALCTGDARASVADSVVWMDETGPGTALRLGDFQGLLWGPRTMGFTPGSRRTRTWWIVAWLGATADTSRIVWTVPVTASTTYSPLPLVTPDPGRTFTWLLIDPRLPNGLVTYPGPDSTWTPRQECATARVVSGLTLWEPGDTLGWSRRFGSLGQTLSACLSVAP